MNPVSKLLFKISFKIESIAKRIETKKAKLIEKGGTRDLYRTYNGHLYWLSRDGYLDNQIINFGIFEKETTEAIYQLVKEGDTVVDIGANIGYYTVILSKIVGSRGKVLAFEPTHHFRRVLKNNISVNKLINVEIIPYGFSNEEISLNIDIGPSSATLHSPPGYDKILSQEKISLVTFNSFFKNNNTKNIDFIKIDIDGHEPAFFDGAWDALSKYDPTIIFEISHLHYLQAGMTAWDFYDKIISNNYNIFLEKDLSRINNKVEFLRSCADFSRSSNVLISKKPSLQ